MKELRVGIAGLGRLGRVHAANLAHKIPGAVLTAACVPGADSQAYARQELGLEKVYGDFREMVADPELDAVAIVSPSGEHCWQIEAALDAGKHVFSEKPLGVTMEQCLQAEAAVARHPELVCMLGFMRRYDKSYAYAKEKIAAGAIGTPYLVKSTGIDPEAVVEGAKEYICSLAESLNVREKYLSHERLLLKAKYAATIAVTNPGHSTGVFQNLVMSCPWETSAHVKEHFDIVLKAITG